ncbi:MAG: hypothetical protein M3405_17070 [Acidobacteriota bacterium]|jgi:hypothetical protein|nr:hypothetical protein [Acidobacteriota bacterium]
MEAATSLTKARTSENSNFAIDTTFVLFFLAVDLGQNLNVVAFDTIFLGLTLLAVVVLPYFIQSDEKPEFGNWLLGRSLIVVFAIMLGLMFKQTLGVVLPESFRFLPFTLLIVTAMLSCYIQFYSFFRLRSSN